MKPTVSLIISFYNKIELLEYIFIALERQTCKNFEVIVADDGSNEETIAKLNELKKKYPFPIKHVWHEDKGWRKNAILNKAVTASECDYLIFIDGDCIPHPKFIQEHLENRKEKQVISGRRVMLTQKVSQKLNKTTIRNGYLDHRAFFPLLKETLFDKQPTHIENMIRIRNKIIRRLFVKDKTRGVWGCNFSLWKKDLLAVNGFDERFVYPGFGEDVDLDNRLRKTGVYPVSKKHLVTQYHVFHKHFDTLYEPNMALVEENKKRDGAFSPYGINKITE